MNKAEFIEKLKKGLFGLPEVDIERSVEFYSEIIDDKIEDGLSEEEAVEQLGSVEAAVAQIISETSLKSIVKKKMERRRSLRVWEIVLLALGSPIWLSLLIAAAAVIFSTYVTLWSAVIVIWAMLAVTVCVSSSGIFGTIVFIIEGNTLQGIALFALALICAGLSIYMFYGCKYITLSFIRLTKKILFAVKTAFVKKEAEQ